ncbi:hypothetical protein H1C71_029511, partial [Ictidomys tridecemlineatus]
VSVYVCKFSERPEMGVFREILLSLGPSEDASIPKTSPEVFPRGSRWDGLDCGGKRPGLSGPTERSLLTVYPKSASSFPGPQSRRGLPGLHPPCRPCASLPPSSARRPRPRPARPSAPDH